MYDRPPGTDISERLQRRLTCLSQAHSKIQRYNDQCEENKERKRVTPTRKSCAWCSHSQTTTKYKNMYSS